jgi:hypothetical protein
VLAGLSCTVRCKSQFRLFVWWPISYLESQKVQVDWLCVDSCVLSPLIHMVDLPHSTIDTVSPLVAGAEVKVTPPRRHLPPVATEVDESAVPRRRSPLVGTEAGKSERSEHEHLTHIVTRTMYGHHEEVGPTPP